MTCGIYCLYFECDDGHYYIGKSINIEHRYSVHCSELRRNIQKNKILSLGYSLWGIPSFSVVEEVILNDDLLYGKEKIWVEHFDSFNNGMNETPGGRGTGYGEQNSNAIYSNEQIIKAFHLLLKPDYTFKEICALVPISHGVLENISAGTNHLWLKEACPTEYTLLMQNKRSRQASARCAKALGIVYPLVISPEGITYKIDNATAFAKEHGLDQSAFGKVLRNQASHHKGWKLLT